MSKVIDELDPPSREFYERAKFKLTLSLFFAALGMMFLGLSSQAGGRSRANHYLGSIDTLTDDSQTQFQDLESGYGFACFSHLLGFILSIAAALYISPLINTPYEKLTVNKPQNFKFADTQSTESYSTREPALATAVSPSAPSPVSSSAPKGEYHSKFASVNNNV